MSQSVTVSTLVERVRQLCDLPPFTTDTPVTSAAILDLIRTSLSMLGGIVREYSDEELLTTSSLLSTQANVPVVSLPVAFSDLVRLSWVKSDTIELLLDRAGVQEWSPNTWGAWSSWDGNGVPKYRVMGANVIELYPTPTAVYSLRAYYSTGIYVSSTGDVVTMRDGWDQWVVFNTCALVRQRQQKSAEDPGPGGFIAQRDYVEQSIRRQMKRDRWGSAKIQDKRSRAWDPRTRRQLPWRY